MDSTTSNKTRSGAKKIVAIVLLVALLVFGIYFYWNYFYTYSEGNRFGLLQKFSHKGNLFKTYEGEMILSSVRSNANVPIASEKFFFSVTDDKVADKLMNLQGRNITVRYKEKKGALSWRGDSNYIVDSVRVEEERPPTP